MKQIGELIGKTIISATIEEEDGGTYDGAITSIELVTEDGSEIKIDASGHYADMYFLEISKRLNEKLK